MRVPGPRNRSIDAKSPTAAITPSRTATASAHGFAASPVQIRFALTIRPAGPSCCRRNARPGSLALPVGFTTSSPSSQERPPIHKQMLHPRRKQRWLLKCRGIAECRRIKHNDIRKPPSPKYATIGKPKDFSRKPGTRANRLLKRNQLLIKGIPKLARKRSIRPRMRHLPRPFNMG